MLDTLFNPSMLGFALLMLVVAVHPRVPTGTTGALGCVLMAVAAVFALDDSTLTTVSGTQAVLLMFCAGASVVAARALLTIRRALNAPRVHPMRRRTDYGDLGDAERA